MVRVCGITVFITPRKFASVRIIPIEDFSTVFNNIILRKLVYRLRNCHCSGLNYLEIFSMRPLSESTSRVSGKCFERKFVALGRIAEHWSDVVGQQLSDKATPVKLNYRKGIKGKRATATLDIGVDSANATMLHYQKDLILARINQLFGDDWITAIRFVNVPANIRRARPEKPKPQLDDSEKKLLSDMVLSISDNEIQNRLLSLGEAIVRNNK